MEISEAIKLGAAKLAELKLDDWFIPKLDTYTKPTNHFQRCWICHKNLKKGDKVVREMNGVSRDGRHFEYCYSHLGCHLAMVIHTILEVDDETGSEEEPSQWLHRPLP